MNGKLVTLVQDKSDKRHIGLLVSFPPNVTRYVRYVKTATIKNITSWK